MNHGKRNNYYQGKCRCDECHSAALEYDYARRRRLKEELDTIRRNNLEQAAGGGGDDWYTHGKCKDVDPSVFFPEPRDDAGTAKAKAICASCPVRAKCLDYALRTHTNDGVFGGYSANERRTMAHGGVPA